MADDIHKICDDFEAAWNSGKRLDIAAIVADFDKDACSDLLSELVPIELWWRRHEDLPPRVEEYLSRFPGFAQIVEAAFSISAAEHQKSPPRSETQANPDLVKLVPSDRVLDATFTYRKQTSLQIRCPHCHQPIEVVDNAPSADVSCSECGSAFKLATDAETIAGSAQPTTVGHYRLLDKLGQVAFGTVWKAYDTELDRTIALKIPRSDRLGGEDAEKFLREARAAAQVRQPNIVSVYEVIREDGRIYIASDLVEGASLDE